MFEFKLDDWSIIKNIFSNINKTIDKYQRRAKARQKIRNIIQK